MTTAQVIIDGRHVSLTNDRIIGVGGEATVFEHRGQAVKVYTQPTADRAAKVLALLPRASGLSSAVIAPQQVARDPKTGEVVGFTMDMLDTAYTDLRQLSVKRYRSQAGLTARDVVGLFLDAHATLSAIHHAGMVVGDLNDLNLMFCGAQMAFIDTDSFQFDGYPCRVATEAFIDPLLYDVDLATGTHFMPENDWYSFAVLLFKSLLLAHPYGGVHPTFKTLTARAQANLSVLSSDVVYPRIAYSPDLLTDELAALFDCWFTNGDRTTFAASTLQDYLAALTTCPACGAAYPSHRSRCPMCAAVLPVMLPTSTHAETLLQTDGDIIAWAVVGRMVRVLTHEDGKVVYHELDKHRTCRRVVLFNTMPEATYAFLGSLLVVSPAPGDETLLVVDVSGDTPQPVLQTTTVCFGGRQPVFGTTDRQLYRIAGGYLLCGSIEAGSLVERPVLAVADGQTWFTVNPTGDGVFGYFRVFGKQQYWLLADAEHASADLSPLDPGEVLLEVDVKFASQSFLVSRSTQLNGAERVRLDEVDRKGRRLASMLIDDTRDFVPIGASAYSGGVVLRAMDGGIEQVRLKDATRRSFTQTEAVVRGGDSLTPYVDGLLTVRDRRVMYITI